MASESSFYLEDYRDLVSTLATVATICQFLTGSSICREFIRKGSTGDVSSLPLVMGALTNWCWFRYGLLVEDTALIVVNGVGASLNSLYSACFYAYSGIRRRSVQIQVVGALSFYLTLLAYIHHVDLDYGINTCGMVAAGLAVGFFASPLANLGNVLRTRSTETLPFPMIVANFILTGLWVLYGSIIGDTFVKVPNGLGWLLSTIQLILFCIYPSSDTSDLLPNYKRTGARPKTTRRGSKEILLA